MHVVLVTKVFVIFDVLGKNCVVKKVFVIEVFVFACEFGQVKFLAAESLVVEVLVGKVSLNLLRLSTKIHNTTYQMH